MTDSDVDTSRVTVRTYVPGYQREEWDDHAEELGMSRSEYVRTMVQAGRRGFLDGSEPHSSVRIPGDGATDGEETETARERDVPADVPDLEESVLDALSTETYLSWEELLEAVTGDIEGRLEQTLQELQAADRVRYSGPNGGYTLDEQ